MKKFQAIPEEFIGAIKRQFVLFIETSNVLDKAQKDLLIKDIGSNWDDYRFDASELVTWYSETVANKWLESNFELTSFWKTVVIENSKINNEPHVTANKALEEFEKNFKTK